MSLVKGYGLPLDRWERMENYAKQTGQYPLWMAGSPALLTEELLTPKQRRRTRKKYRKNGF